MMQDYVRTSTYQKAILGNLNDFKVSIERNNSNRSHILFHIRYTSDFMVFFLCLSLSP